MPDSSPLSEKMLRQIPLFILEDCQRDWTTLSHSGNLCSLCFLPSPLLVSLSHLLKVLFGITFLQNYLTSNPCLKICFWEIQIWTHTDTQTTCTHTHAHTHLFIYFGDGGMKASKMYFSIIGFPKFTICCVLSLKPHLIYNTATK